MIIVDGDLCLRSLIESRLYDLGVIVELLLLDLEDVPVALDKTDNTEGLTLG